MLDHQSECEDSGLAVYLNWLCFKIRKAVETQGIHSSLSNNVCPFSLSIPQEYHENCGEVQVAF